MKIENWEKVIFFSACSELHTFIFVLVTLFLSNHIKENLFPLMLLFKLDNFVNLETLEYSSNQILMLHLFFKNP